MKQSKFEIDYLKALKNNVNDNLHKYQLSTFEIADDGIEDVPELEIPDNVCDELLLHPFDEFENSVLVYENLKGMNPLLASQEALWTFLSHKTFFPYVQKRWSDVFDNDKISVSFIKNHWFGWKRNAIGRLWWNAYLTRDDKRNNPYELTEILYKQSDITQNLSFSDALFPNKNAILAILSFYKNHPEILSEAINERNRFITQSLNRWGGIKNLSFFDIKDFTIEMERNLDTILSIGAKDNHNDFEWIQS